MQHPKQVIVVRKDLNMTKGKIAAQVAHASMGAITKFFMIDSFGTANLQFFKDGSAIYEWLFNGSFTKVCVYVNSEEELMDLWYNVEQDEKLISCLITDSGKTMFDGVPTVTCFSLLGWQEDVNKHTGHLKLL